jgi:hypothetical protein
VWTLQVQPTGSQGTATVPNETERGTGERNLALTGETAGLHEHASRRTRRIAMGDKGGKKDKEKVKRQQATKHAEEAQRKEEKKQPKTG